MYVHRSKCPINITVILILPTLIYRFNTISMKIPASILVKIHKGNPKFAKIILKRNEIRKYCVLLLNKNKHKPIEQNRGCRNKSTHFLKSFDIQQRCQDNSMGKGKPYQQLVLEQIDESSSYLKHKN